MELKRVSTKYGEYVFVNESVDTRNGFAHVSRLFKNDYELAENRVNYLNRTWEYYRYQTAMLGAVHNLIKERRDDLEKAFRTANGIKRMNDEKRKALDDVIDKDVELTEYYELYNSL